MPSFINFRKRLALVILLAAWSLTGNAASFLRLQVLMPGESAAPGTGSGKTGTPIAQTVGVPFTVTVNGVDFNWNLINTNDTVKIVSSDANAGLPPNAALVGGTKSFTVTLNTVGAATITASNVTHTGIFPNTGSSTYVANTAPASQAKAVVAIHDSELTRALETILASGATPASAGTTGYEWWPTNWHYFVMPESVKETLRSDGTAYEVLGDADISAGRLLDSNGQPRCPIFISLASEAIRDDEIAALTNYVAAGGVMFVGSSAFTRNPDGTTRGDFAIGNQMGVHSANPTLQNWVQNFTFSKSINDPVVSHIPGGVLSWMMPFAAEEISWGVAPNHNFPGSHSIWRVQPTDATVVARGDFYPYVSVKPYGKGKFIYCAAMQPLLGHGGNAPGMYAYGILRNSIQQAFAASLKPVPKLSPWPYAYDSALIARHDFENYRNMIVGIEGSAQFEYTNGIWGDYYFCTGTLRTELTNSPIVIASLRRAVTNYGATISPHNGGLANANDLSLTVTNYDYWHWGPDEVLSITPPGYASGLQYATISISNSFNDMDGWLSGITNSIRTWVSPYFNSTREASFGLISDLGVKTSGEQKLSPFPSWVLSTSLQTPGKRYPFISIPTSDWYVENEVAQALESGHTLATAQAASDYYYNLGALVNIYSHSSSAGGGLAGPLEGQSLVYSVAKPRIWSTNSVGIYYWWLARSNSQMVATYSTNGLQSRIALSITGATDPRSAVEVLLPQTSIYGLQVLTNGVTASGSNYRVNGQVVKVFVGTAVTNAEVRYSVVPVAQNDVYSLTQATTLSASAPGVLANDQSDLSGSLTASLVSGPSSGALTLNSDGSFNYTPNTTFAGVDSFAYRAVSSATSSVPATVTISVVPPADLFYDNFGRATNADVLAPWQTSLGTWAITNSTLQGTSSYQSYGFAYVSNNWSDYAVQGKIQFQPGAFGGGFGGRLNPMTGTHYAAWVYPEGSSGGSSVIKLVKFQNWTTFGYNFSAYAPIAQANLPGVGTNWHSVKLAFFGKQMAVYYDDVLYISAPDEESVTYTNGGISVDMWTDVTTNTVSVKDVVAIPLIAADSYALNENTSLTVPAPGVLTNDTPIFGSGLTASLVSGPSNGALTFNADGSFAYVPNTNFAGVDSFIYQGSDVVTNLGTATVTLRVNPALIVTVNSQSRVYGATNPVFTGSLIGVQPGDDITAVFSSSTGTNSAVGTYPISISFLDPGNKLGNYSITTNSGSLTIAPASLSVTADNKARLYGALNPTLTGTLSGVMNNDAIAASYVTSADTNAIVGVYPIVPLLSGPIGNYTVVTNNGSLTINPAPLTVNVDSQSRPYAITNPTFTGTIVGIQNNDSITATYNTAAITTSPAGNYSIGATLNGPKLGSYSVTVNGGTLSVTPVLLAVQADAKSRSYGVTNPVFTATYTGFVNGEGTNVLSGVLVGSTPATTNSPVGTYAISVSGQSAANYTLQYVDGILTVGATPLLVAADDASRAYGQTNPVFGVSYTGLVNGEGSNALGGTLLISTTATTNSAVGTYPISASGLSATNYTISYTNGTLTINSYALSVTASNASRSYGATNPVFTGSVVGVQNGDNITASYTTPAGTNSAVGSYAIVVTLNDPDGKLVNYSVTTNNGLLTVSAASLTVTADNQNRNYGTTNPVLTGSVVGIQNGDDITGSYTTLATTNSAVGPYAITATLNDPNGKLGNYSVTTNNGVLTVNAAALTVSADNQSRMYGAVNPTLTGSVSGLQNGDNITASYTTTATTNSAVGPYAITIGLVDPGSKLGNYNVTTNNGVLTITTAPLTVTANNAARNYGATNPVFGGVLTGIQNGDNITASYASAATPLSGVGGYSIVPSLVDPNDRLGNYTVTSQNGTLTINAAPLTGQAEGKSRLYGQTNPVFTATYMGFVNGEGTNVLSGILTGITSATTNSPVGTYPISVSGQSAANYTIQYVDGLLTVGASPLLVTANDASRAYGATNPVFTVSYTGFVNVEGSNVLGGALVVSTTAETNSPVGTYPISASGLSSTNYAISYTNGTLTISSYALSVTASNASRSYGATNPVFTGSISGLQNGDNITANYMTVAGTNSAVGSYPILVTLNDPNGKLVNYSVTTNNGLLTVSAASLVVTADSQTKIYGSTNPMLTGSVVGVQNGDNLAGDYTTTAATGSPVGNYPISAAVVDPDGKLGNYSVITNNGTLTINAATLLVSADNYERTYGATNPVLTATLTGFVNGDTQGSAIGGTPVLNTVATTNSGVGGYTITAAQGTLSATNYVFAFTNGVLTVTPALLTGHADSKVRLYGQTNPVFTVTYTGFQNGEDPSVLSGVLVGSTPATTNSPVGIYPISVSGQSAANYTIQFVDGTLTVGATPLLVAANDASRAYGQTNPIFSATISGYVNGEGSTSLSGALVLSTVAETNSPVGFYPILPSGLSSTNYAISYTNGTLTISSFVLSVTASNAIRTYGAANLVLGGSLVGVQNGDDITASYTTVADTNSAVGSYTILATLNDPDHKLANYSVTTNNGVLTITTAALAITADNQSKIYGTTNPVLTGLLTGVQNGDNITGSFTTTAVTGSGVGTYAITASLLDPHGKLDNYSVTTNDGALTISGATLTVTADPQTRGYGATNPILTATLTGFVNGDTQGSAVTGTADVTTSANAGSGVGNYIITAAQGNLVASNYVFTFVSGTLSVTPVLLTVQANNQSRGYGQSNGVFTATYTGFVNGEGTNVLSGVLVGSTPATTNSPVGTYPISVSGQSAANYTIQYVDGILTVGATPLLVAANDASRAYGQTNPVFGVSYSGFVNGEGSNALGGTLLISTTATTNSAVGTYPISASGLSATNYAISYTNGTLTINSYALSVTASNASRSYGATNPVFTGSVVGVQNGDNITASYTTPAGTNSAVGGYAIVVTLNDPDGKLVNYSVTTNNGLLTVSAASLTVTADNQNRNYGTTNPVLTGSVVGIQNGDDITGSYTTLATTNSAVGPYAITATLNDPNGKLGNYSVTTNNGVLTVNAAVLTVSADNQSRMYGAVNPTLTGSVSGLQNGDNITASYATTAATNSAVGPYAITIGLVDPGSKLGNYNVTTNNGVLAITPAPLTVTANHAARNYGATNPVFGGVLTGIQNGDDITASYASAATPLSGVGGYNIVPSLVDPNDRLGNYTVTSQNGTLTINAAPLTGQADGKSRLYGQTNPVFTATYMGFVNGEGTNVLSGVLAGSTTAVTNSPVGNYPISVGGQSAANYTIQYVDGLLTVGASPLLVTANDASRAYGATNPMFTVSYTGFVNGEGTNALGGTLLVSTTAETNSPVGTYPISASGLSSTNYAISYTNGTLTINSFALSVTASNASRV